MAHHEIEEKRRLSSGSVLSYEALMFGKLKEVVKTIRFHDMSLDFVLNFLGESLF